MNKENKFSLVLTGTKGTFFHNEKNLLLGHWCVQKNENLLNKLDYHISGFESEYENEDISHYSNNLKINDILLEDIIKELEDYYNFSWKKKHWQMFLGPWISRYVFLIKNRFLSLKYVYDHYDIKKVMIADYDDFSLITKDMVDFKLSSNDNLWNLKLLSLLWCKYIDPDKKIEVIKYSPKEIFKTSKIKNKSPNLFKKYFIYILKILEKFFCRNNKIIFYESYFGNKFLIIKTLLKLKNCPFYYQFDDDLKPIFKLCERRKNKIKLNTNLQNYEDKSKYETDKIINKIIYDNFYNFLPTYYLESIKELKYKLKTLLLPKSPKIVFSANAFWRDNIFKIWLIENVKKKGKLISFQHGCNFGTTKISPIEDFEIKFSDKFLTWGWTDKKRNNVEKFGIIKNIGKKIVNVERDNILLPISSTYNYVAGEGTGELFSKRSCMYQEILFEFLSKLPKKISQKLHIRGNYVSEKMRDSQITNNIKMKFSNFHFQNHKKDFSKSINEYGLIINLSDSTTFLETISMNKPTVSYLDSKLYFNHFREDAKALYQELKKVGIIHTDITELINFLIKVDFNFHDWWNQKDVKKAKEIFIENYCKPIKNLPLKLENYIKN